MFNLSDKPSPNVWEVATSPDVFNEMLRFNKKNPKATLKEQAAFKLNLREQARHNHLRMKTAGLPTRYLKTEAEAKAYAALIEDKCGFVPVISETSFL